MATSVLIVDDHSSFRSSARRLLEAEGYEVVGEAADGVSGLRAARELSPEVVLLDIHLPDADGFDIAARLSANGVAPAVILVSSREREELRPLIEHCGARGFISKCELSGDAVEALLR